MSPPIKTAKKRRSRAYTKGELNLLIDDICHPLYKTNKVFVLLDGGLHCIIEQNPPQSALKFLKYNLPTIISQIRAFSNSKKSSNKLSEMSANFPTTQGGKKSRKKGMCRSVHKNVKARKGNERPHKVT